MTTGTNIKVNEAYLAGYNRAKRAVQGLEILVRPGLVELPAWVRKQCSGKYSFILGYQDGLRGRRVINAS